MSSRETEAGNELAQFFRRRRADAELKEELEGYMAEEGR
jgi:hypothetical protein